MVGQTKIDELIEYQPAHTVNTPYERATFGMGCFWGADALFGGTKGVLRTRVGYAGGTKDNPKYRDLGDHTEVIEIEFDPQVISYKQLLDLFWNNHEYGLTKKMKKQYMSLILFHSPEQKVIAEQSREEEQVNRAPEVIITELAPASTFYPAEDYHQKYRLQQHKDLCAALGLNTELLQTSFVAAKLNGYVAGVGGVTQYLKEVDKFGLTPSQQEYVQHYVKENEGAGLFC